MIYQTLAFAALYFTVSNAVNLDSYTFEQYVTDYNLKFHPSELETRKNLFQTELARIKTHNSKNLGWTETINKFSALTAKEKKAYHGVSKGNMRSSKKHLKSAKPLPDDFKMVSVDLLPRHVDWREKGVVSAVKDQGQCGSCWAFSSTAVLESHVAIASGLLFDLSVQQIASCTENPNACGGTGGCFGATAELAYEYATNSGGIFQEYQYGYNSYYGKDFACAIPDGTTPKATINGYVTLPANNYTAMMNAVANVGPVVVALDASAWSAYQGGIFNGCNQETPDVDHGVAVVGYGEENGQKYWLIRNSWSASWGEAGYIRLARFDDEEQRCGVDITPQDGIACAGDDQPVKACGTCAILFDGAYPLNAAAIKK